MARCREREPTIYLSATVTRDFSTFDSLPERWHLPVKACPRSSSPCWTRCQVRPSQHARVCLQWIAHPLQIND